MAHARMYITPHPAPFVSRPRAAAGTDALLLGVAPVIAAAIVAGLLMAGMAMLEDAIALARLAWRAAG